MKDENCKNTTKHSYMYTIAVKTLSHASKGYVM